MMTIDVANPLPSRNATSPMTPHTGRWPWRAMAAALAVEAILLGLTTGWLASGTPTPQTVSTDAPVMLSMLVPEPEATPTPAAKPAEPAKLPSPSIKREVVAKPDTSHVRKPAQVPRATVNAEAPLIETVSGADAPPAPSAAPATLPAAPPVAASSGPDERFVAKLRAAVQAAVVYPMALRGMGLAASIDVEFVYMDGRVSNVHVARPGHVATLDEAAIAAVQRAAMPSAPPSLAGTPHAFKVRVIFRET
ncbi:TonB family protein [Pandoraea horticolens]|nr:TonB family protein [Pandoraea horticolens]